MKHSLLTLALLISLGFSAFAEPTIRAWNFGPDDVSLPEGFTRAPGGPSLKQDPIPDPICANGLDFQSTTTFDLPNGEYLVGIWYGIAGPDIYAVADCIGKPRRVTANNATLINDDVFTYEMYHKMLFLGESVDVTPALALYDELVAPNYGFVSKKVSVTDGKLTLNTTGGTRVNALVVAPANQQAAFDAFVKKTDKTRREAVEKAWIKDTWKPKPAPASSAEDKKLGYIAFIPNPEIGTYEDGDVNLTTVPTREDAGKDLTLFAARGEWEAGHVGIFPLADSGEVTISVSDLIADSGAVIPASQVRIERIQYAVEPGPKFAAAYLKEASTVSLMKGFPREFYLNFHIPESAKAGVYKGAVSLRSERGERKIPVTFQVLNIVLPDFTRRDSGGPMLGFFYYNPGWAKSVDAYKEADLRFMKERQFIPSIAAGPPWDFRKLAIAAGIDQPTVCYHGGIPNADPVQKGNQPVAEAQSPFALETKTKQNSPEFFKLYLEALDKTVADIQEAGFKTDDFIFGVSDENGSRLGQIGVDMLTEIIKRIHDYGKLITIPAANEPIELQYAPYVNYFCFNFPYNTEYFKIIRDAGAKVSLYNLGRERFPFGFYSWRVGSEITMSWHYMVWRRNMLYGFTLAPYAIVPGSEKPYPTITSERSREGVDDYRYLFLLESLVKRGEKSKNTDVIKAAKAGRKILDITRGRISENYKVALESGLTDAVLQRLRWRVGCAAEDLQNAFTKAGVIQ